MQIGITGHMIKIKETQARMHHKGTTQIFTRTPLHNVGKPKHAHTNQTRLTLITKLPVAAALVAASFRFTPWVHS